MAFSYPLSIVAFLVINSDRKLLELYLYKLTDAYGLQDSGDYDN